MVIFCLYISCKIANNVDLLSLSEPELMPNYLINGIECVELVKIFDQFVFLLAVQFDDLALRKLTPGVLFAGLSPFPLGEGFHVSPYIARDLAASFHACFQSVCEGEPVSQRSRHGLADAALGGDSL